MTDHIKTMAGNCKTIKMMDEIAELKFAIPEK